jgi:hypothetical protein
MRDEGSLHRFERTMLTRRWPIDERPSISADGREYSGTNSICLAQWIRERLDIRIFCSVLWLLNRTTRRERGSMSRAKESLSAVEVIETALPDELRL